MDKASEQSPLVTVIMTAYNAEPYIKPAIESVLAQTHTDFELLVADDCSTDRTRAVIDQLAKEYEWTLAQLRSRGLA